MGDMSRASTVAISNCPDYEEERVRSAVRGAVRAIGGLEPAVRPGQNVLLKANMLAPAGPEEAATTHPAVVRAVAELVLEAGGVPVVADSPGYIYAGGKCRALKACGIRDVGVELGVETTQFESLENPFVEVGVPQGAILQSVYAARMALEADVIITLPKIKTHAGTWYTGAVKNMFGAVATRTRKEAHRLAAYQRFSQAIVDIYSVLAPRTKMAIMDAVVGMEGEGPRHGAPRQLGLIMASCDPVALDAVASKVIGFEPLEILTTKFAADRGLGVGDLDAIAILGEQVKDVAVEFEKPSGRQVNLPPLLMKAVHRLIKIRPGVNRSSCDKCKICAKSCPVDAISMASYPEIDRDLCIECYCCNEMCPTGAMEIRKSWLARRIG